MDEEKINEKLAGASPDEILAWALKTFPYRIGMTTSFQNSGIVLLDMIRKIAFGFPVFFIDTGFHFPETLEFKARLIREWNLNVHTIIPQMSRARLGREHGPLLYERDPDLCCRINKVTPWPASRRRSASGIGSPLSARTRRRRGRTWPR